MEISIFEKDGKTYTRFKKQDSCQCKCDDIDGYEYAEECEDYETD